ncbi:MAG TPA: GNAT family N-acetyltransferase [Baekduia sp.]|nr:GNAT family N-acetyltransferase [Baekduia sp.]
MDLAIRPAAPEDLAAVVGIYNASIPGRLATADLEPVDVEARRAWFEAHDARRPLWVAERGGAIAGWLSLEDFYGRAAYHRTAEVSIYVADERQGEGLGRALLAHAVERAPGLGLANLVGYVFGHNAASLALFARFGFERWGLLPAVAELDGRMADLVIVGRALGRGEA